MNMLVEQLKFRFHRYIKLININIKNGKEDNLNKTPYGLYIRNDDFGVNIFFDRKDLGHTYYGIYTNHDNLFNNILNVFSLFIKHNDFYDLVKVYNIPLWKWLQDEYEVFDASVLSNIINC